MFTKEHNRITSIPVKLKAQQILLQLHYYPEIHMGSTQSPLEWQSYCFNSSPLIQRDGSARACMLLTWLLVNN